MSKINIQVAPIVSIHQINHDLIIAKIESGYFNQQPSFFNISNVKQKYSNKSILDKIENTSHTAITDRCIHTNITGTKTESITTGVRAFKGKKGGRCYYCRLKFTHEPLGYAIAVQYKNDIPTYFIEDAMICGPRCVLKYIDYIKLPARHESQYRRLTNNMLEDKYGPNIIPAQDFRTLEVNGGTESKEVWENPNIKYTEVFGIMIIPIKREYKITVSK